jgi:hypothetical protein
VAQVVQQAQDPEFKPQYHQIFLKIQIFFFLQWPLRSCLGCEEDALGENGQQTFGFGPMKYYSKITSFHLFLEMAVFEQNSNQWYLD